MHSFIQEEINKSVALLLKIQNDEALFQVIQSVAKKAEKALREGKKILFAGNGGSAADSQHLAAELVSRLQYDRPGLSAIALTTDTSALTAIGNDYSFDYIFARQIEAIGQGGDVFIGISTSGKSLNILRALEVARTKSILTVGMTGAYVDKMQNYCHEIISIPATETPKIQECHILIGHIICALIEDLMFAEKYKKDKENGRILSAHEVV